MITIRRRNTDEVGVIYNGTEIISQYRNGDRYDTYYDTYYDEGMRVLQSGTENYRYDAEGQHLKTMSAGGTYEENRYDPYGNRIASYKTSRWSNTKSVSIFRYKRREDGSVSSEYVDTKGYNNYDDWLENVPTEFVVADYVPPEKVKRAVKKPTLYYDSNDNSYPVFVDSYLSNAISDYAMERYREMTRRMSRPL